MMTTARVRAPAAVGAARLGRKVQRARVGRMGGQPSARPRPGPTPRQTSRRRRRRLERERNPATPRVALRDRPSSRRPRRATDPRWAPLPRIRLETRPASREACPPRDPGDARDASPRNLEDVYVQCGRSVDAAVEALLALSMAEPRERAPSGRADGAAVGAIPAPRPRGSTDPSAPDLWDALPVELRLLILDRLGSREAARARARLPRFRVDGSRVATSRAGSRLPPDLSVASLASMAAAYPNVTSISFRRCARRVSTASDIARVLRAASAGPGGLHRVRGPRGMRSGRARRGFGRPRRRRGRGRPITELKLSKCAGVTDKSVAALAAHAGAEALTSLSPAGTSTTELGLATASARTARFQTRSTDASGCAGIKGSVALPPLLDCRRCASCISPR